MPGVSNSIMGLGQRGCGSGNCFDCCCLSEDIGFAIWDNLTRSKRQRGPQDHLDGEETASELERPVLADHALGGITLHSLKPGGSQRACGAQKAPKDDLLPHVISSMSV